MLLPCWLRVPALLAEVSLVRKKGQSGLVKFFLARALIIDEFMTCIAAAERFAACLFVFEPADVNSLKPCSVSYICSLIQS